MLDLWQDLNDVLSLMLKSGMLLTAMGVGLTE